MLENTTLAREQLLETMADTARKSAFEALTASKSNSWFTPANICDSARAVMGGIDLDPASCAEANELYVKARRYFTIANDGMARGWSTSALWLNAPYGFRGLDKSTGIYNHGASAWITKAITRFQAGTVEQAVILARGDSTAVRWLKANTITCDANRISFYRPGGAKGGQPVPGTILAYLGPEWAKFGFEFHKYGTILVPWAAPASPNI